ncbi:LacI family DNA-binding transcriptional regulator [Streptomyces radicis]|uniref:LacI family transcriptional regulator n=1 Tax=Streptomyces radicis TaxID=1750517 RepID=A0A3A9VRG6_9ACTN|nr:LacI family DNA-binding transcriptional regulator [Streptomyces radicis]RKN03142.1 LacI family transcriptional regulator [Streptomyces radicis]RKN13059.1 LacI family transcriptional regulator [Streptomyces radicis]
MQKDPTGRRPPGAAARARVTLRDVAREAGVSYATASRAIHPGSRKVNEAARDRVLAVALRLNYTPHFPAQAVARGSTATVALAVSDIADPYFSLLAAGARAAADEAGLTLTLAMSGRDPGRELDIVRRLRGQRPRVIVVAGSRVAESPHREALVEELRAFERGGGRVALISQPDLPFPTVSLDNRDAGRQLAVALAERGYRRVAVISGPAGLRTSADRVEGLARGAADAGIALAQRDVVEGEFTREGGHAGALALVERGLGGIDAIVAVTDVMAVGAMSALRDAGVVPGRDVGVAGFDDIPMAVDVTPELTTVAAPLGPMGARAVRLALAGPAAPMTETAVTGVVLRASTPGPGQSGLSDLSGLSGV